MKRLWYFIVFLLGVVFVSGCSTTSHTEYDSDTDFSSYKSFTWSPHDEHELINPILDSAILDRRVMRAAVRALKAKGFVEVKTDSGETADLLVTFHATSKEVFRSVGYRVGIGYSHYYPYWRHSIHYAVPRGESYEKGTLIIDIVDLKTDRLVWRGWDSSTVNQVNYSEARINKIVPGILDDFPPR